MKNLKKNIPQKNNRVAKPVATVPRIRGFSILLRVFYIMSENKEYSVYFLLNGNCEPIYVGVSSDVKKRVKQHLKEKNFKSYMVLYKSYNKKDCLAIERAIVMFASAFGYIPLNSKHQGYVYKILNRTNIEEE